MRLVSILLALALVAVPLCAQDEAPAEEAPADPGREAFEDFVQQNTPLKREQDPADIAEAALYLVRADNVTGVALNVAGGTEMS